MYLNFFNLNKEPFQVTPDPSFLYLSPGHKEALASIIYGVEKKKGFVLIIGAVGVGKTTILRAFLEKADKTQLKTIYLFNANITYSQLLKYIFKELSVSPSGDDISELVTQLHEVLIEEYKKGRNVLLLIDEAQNMPVDTLENLRMLSNLETATEKLIQVVFSAQPEFERTLNLEVLSQLKQRIAVKAVISPLSAEEGITYIQHRLKTAADKEAAIFTSRALREIVRNARGIPRLINVLCDNSLITAYGYGKKKVALCVVKEIIKDFGITRPLYLWWIRGLISLVIILLAGVFAFKNSEVVVIDAADVPTGDAYRSSSIIRPVTKATATVAASNETKYAQRVVEKGDTLAKLILQVYGHVDSNMIRVVKKANPHILNEDLIFEGGKILFPLIKEK